MKRFGILALVVSLAIISLFAAGVPAQGKKPY